MNITLVRDLTYTTQHWFPPRYRAPAGVDISLLDERHLDVVCRTWPPFVECLRPVVRAVLTHNRSAGVFVDGELASMVLQTYHGGVGALQTVAEYRGRGLAPLVLAALVRNMGQAGVSPQLRVDTDNHVALRVVRKVGFKVIGTSYTVTNLANH